MHSRISIISTSNVYTRISGWRFEYSLLKTGAVLHQEKSLTSLHIRYGRFLSLPARTRNWSYFAWKFHNHHPFVFTCLWYRANITGCHSWSRICMTSLSTDIIIVRYIYYIKEDFTWLFFSHKRKRTSVDHGSLYIYLVACYVIHSTLWGYDSKKFEPRLDGEPWTQ
jgi:hypothetical protein